SVIGAGGVAEMVIEAREAWTTTKKRLEKVVKGGALGAFARARMVERSAAIGKSDGAAVRELQLIFVEAASQGEAGDFEGVLEAIELFFLDGEEYGLIVEKGDCGAAADGRDTKYAHES